MLRIAYLKIHRNTEVKHVTFYNVSIRSNDFHTAVTTIGLFRPIKCVSEEVNSILHSLLCIVNVWTNCVPEAHVSKAQQELNYFFLLSLYDTRASLFLGKGSYPPLTRSYSSETNGHPGCYCLHITWRNSASRKLCRFCNIIRFMWHINRRKIHLLSSRISYCQSQNITHLGSEPDSNVAISSFIHGRPDLSKQNCGFQGLKCTELHPERKALHW